MNKVFVTGGSGFVGRHLISALHQRGVPVRALARSEAAAIAVRAAGAEPVRGDLSDVAPMIEGMTGCDLVIHAAAYVHEHGKLDAFMRVNVRGTQNVIDAARAANVARLVHVSTEAVLADGQPIVQADETRPYPATPAGPYPRTKALAEEAVRHANRGDHPDGLETVIVRPRLIWGDGDTSVLPKLIAAVKAGRFGWIGGGRYPTSTCHIDNVVEGTLLAAERGQPGETYFLTDGEPVEFRAFITEMLETQGVAAGGRVIPRWVARATAAATSWMKQPPVTRTAIALVGHEVTVVDAKARRELGYIGKVSRADGMARLRATAG